MCLFIEKNSSKIAKKDIICYKKCIQFEGNLRTPYTRVPLPNNIIGYTQKAEGHIIIHGKKNYFPPYYIINRGAIHTYKNKPKINNYDNFINNHIKIYKCIIPKGTKYYKGTDWFNTIEYASKKIKYIKDVTDSCTKRLTESNNK